MIEYLYNCIRATAGQDIIIDAVITDDFGLVLKEECSLMLHEPNKDMLVHIEGVYLEDEELWRFTVPASITEGCKGRYWYCIQHANQNVCFHQPIYLV